MDLDKLKFDERGLIPAIVVDAENKKVLTLAYMNRESLEISMREGRTCFWSRSRRELWRKGETSGNVQRIVSITADCDMDALVVKVEKAGPACHTGAESCFFNPVYESDELSEFSIELYTPCSKAARPSSRRAATRPIFSKRAWTRYLKKLARNRPRSSSPGTPETGARRCTR